MQVAATDGVRSNDAFSALLQKLERQPDFSALHQSIRKVQSVLGNESSRLQSVVEAVIDDPGLTGRLLRLINAAHYRSMGGGQITSIQRAVSVMGFNSVRNLAVTLRLLDKVPADKRCKVLREDFLRSLLAARLASELTLNAAHLEESYMAALFQNLGRMLLAAHLPEEALGIRDAVPRQSRALSDLEDEAANKRLRVSHAEIGQEIAKSWGWPESMRLIMRRDDWPRHRCETKTETMRVVGKLANELSDLLLYWPHAEWEARCNQMEGEAGSSTGLKAKDMTRALAFVRADLESLADLVGLPVSQLNRWSQTDAVNGQAPAPVHAATGADMPANALPEPVAKGPAPSGSNGQANTALLASEVQEISEILISESGVEAVPERSLMAVFAGMGARRGVLFLKKGNAGVMVPVNVVGEPLLPQGKDKWVVDPDKGEDLFSKLCARGADTLIDDATQPQIANRLPASFACAGPTNSFLIMPMTVRKKAVGMLYLDRGDGQTFEMTEERMQLLRMLRNQALMAMK